MTSIEQYAFWVCDSLTSITIPEGVTSIGDGTFCNCRSLANVYCKPTTPPSTWKRYTMWYAFDDNAEGRKIYVPWESVEAYKVADGWKDYADAIKGYYF